MYSQTSLASGRVDSIFDDSLIRPLAGVFQDRRVPGSLPEFSNQRISESTPKQVPAGERFMSGPAILRERAAMRWDDMVDRRGVMSIGIRNLTPPAVGGAVAGTRVSTSPRQSPGSWSNPQRPESFQGPASPLCPPTNRISY